VQSSVLNVVFSEFGKMASDIRPWEKFSVMYAEIVAIGFHARSTLAYRKLPFFCFGGGLVVGFDCWYCAAQRMTLLVGVIVGRRVAEVLRVDDCGVKPCRWRGSSDCLIGREIEGRW